MNRNSRRQSVEILVGAAFFVAMAIFYGGRLPARGCDLVLNLDFWFFAISLTLVVLSVVVVARGLSRKAGQDEP